MLKQGIVSSLQAEFNDFLACEKSFVKNVCSVLRHLDEPHVIRKITQTDHWLEFCT